MRTHFALTALIALTLQTTVSRAQPGMNDPLPKDPKVTHGKLANGLTYYIRENRKPEKKVELRLVLKAGSIVEDDDQQGLAHMAEHMAFNGTKNFRKNEIVSFLQDIGVGFGNDLNAYTGFDETVYILPIPTDKPGNLTKGFQVLEDWAHQVTYLDEDINSERAIILEESRLGKSGEERMFKKVYPELFKGSRYAERLPIGKDSIISNFNPDAIRRFYRDWYRPELMAVIVVGDISKSAALDMVKKHFSGLKNPASPRPRTYASVPPYQSSQAMVVTDKEATAYEFSLNYPALPKKPSATLSDYRNDLISDLYVSMLNARFREISQKENPPFVYAYAGFGSYARNHESFNVSASTGTSDIRKGADAVAVELERLIRYGFTPAELDRAKKNMKAGYERSYNNRDKTESEDLAEEYIEHFTAEQPFPGIENEFAYVNRLLEGISLQEMERVTAKIRGTQNRFAYVMGPESAPGQTLPGSQELLASLEKPAGILNIKPYEEKSVAANLLGKKPAAGKVVSKTKNLQLGTTELKLSNGITVSLKATDFKTDEILLNGFRNGGIGGYSVADKHTAENLAAAAGSMGVGEFSPTDLRKSLAGKTVSVAPYFSQTQDGIRGNSGNKDLESMFQLVYLNVTAPRKDSALFRSFIQKNRSQYMMLGANPEVAFIDTMYRVLYQDDPLAPTVIPRSEYFDRISFDRTLEIYKERLGDLTGMHFNIVGSFRENDIIPLIETYLASLPAGKRKTTFTDNKVRPLKGSKQISYRKGKEDKSLILAVYGGETAYSPELSRNIAALSEIMNIRIIEEMREKIQGIYGGSTFGGMEKYPYSSYQFVLQLPCGPQKADTLIQEFNRELKELADKGPEQKYLDKVKKQWNESYRTDMKTNPYWLEKLGQIRNGEVDADQFLNREKYVNQIRPSDIQAAARLIRDAPSRLIAVQLPEGK